MLANIHPFTTVQALLRPDLRSACTTTNNHSRFDAPINAALNKGICPEIRIANANGQNDRRTRQHEKAVRPAKRQG